jgi:hypothetical protein
MDHGATTLQGSLRWCIEELNAGKLVAAEESRARIHFNIRSEDGAVGGRVTIKLKARLPDVQRTATIDGTTQPDPSGGEGTDVLMWTPAVVLDGTEAGGGSGIGVVAPDVVLKGLTIQRFERNGVFIAGARTRVVGVHLQENGVVGIGLDETAVGSVIGDPTTGGPQGRVVVVGNPAEGIYTAAPHTQIANVYVGVEADGQTFNGNGASGINLLETAAGSTIGDADVGADGLVVVSGNQAYGIKCKAPHVTIVNTYVGVAADGMTPVPNAGEGILVIAAAVHASIGVPSTDPGSTLNNHQHSLVVVSGNSNSGILTQVADNTLGRVYIGVAADGVTPVPNRAVGLALNAFDTATPTTTIQIGPGAIISGNHGPGIYVIMELKSPTTIIIDGCLIGLIDPSGTTFNTALADGTNLNSIASQLTAVGNFKHGIELAAQTGDVFPITITHTLIGGNFLDGIDPPTSKTAENLHYTSTNYPNTIPLLGNDRADHVCERCRCTSITTATTVTTIIANTSTNTNSPPSWLINWPPTARTRLEISYRRASLPVETRTTQTRLGR